MTIWEICGNGKQRPSTKAHVGAVRLLRREDGKCLGFATFRRFEEGRLWCASTTWLETVGRYKTLPSARAALIRKSQSI